MEPIVTIALSEYNKLTSTKSISETLLEIARKEMYLSVMEAIKRQDSADRMHYTLGLPWITTEMPYDEFKKHYISEK